jgi:hypothetical protein
MSGVQLGTNYTLLVVAFTISATILVVNELITLAVIMALAAGASGFAFIRLLKRLDRWDRMQ